MVSPEAGWYADPTDPSAVRWWDGAAWSAQTRPAPRELALAGAAVGASSASAGVGASPSPAHASPAHASPTHAPTPAPAPDPVVMATAAAATDLPAVVTIGADPTPAPVAAAPAAPATTPHAATPAPAPTPPAPAAAHETATSEAPAVVDRSRPGARPPVTSAPEHAAPHVDPVAPEDEGPVDRSRPGARRPSTPAPPPVEVAMPPAAAAPIKPGATPGSTPSQPSAAWIDANYPTTPAGGGSGFGAAPQRFGGSSPMGAPAKIPRPPMHWKIPVAIAVVLVLVLGAAAAVGVPRYFASKAQAQAALAPDVLTRTAPKTLSGQRKVALPGMNATAVAQQLTGAGAAWAWAQAYGTRDAFTLYVASDVPVVDRADAVRALTSHDAAAELIARMSAGLTTGSSGRAVAGTPVDYASPVGGKSWCMPLTVSGVAGGYCLWTSGKEFLQVLTMPGIEQVSAKSTMTALKQMAAAVTKAGPTSTLVPKTSGK